VKRLISQILAGILGLYLAIRFISDVEFAGSWQILILAGSVLGLINFFLKPILKFITLPLRILTFGLFTFLINIGIIFFIDLIFPQLKIPGILNLFLTSLIIWGLNFLFSILFS